MFGLGDAPASVSFHVLFPRQLPLIDDEVFGFLRQAAHSGCGAPSLTPIVYYAHWQALKRGIEAFGRFLLGPVGTWTAEQETIAVGREERR